eukprot:3209936-Alexandrium_andersonii.AAC.1
MQETRLAKVALDWRSLASKRAIVAQGTARRRAWTGRTGRGRPRMWEEAIQDYLDAHGGIW